MFCFSVVGDAKDIDWYAPSREKILLNRQDIFVSRSDETTSTLTIYHANVDSAGIYKCVAKNGDKEAQATVQVKIFRKSHVFFFFFSKLEWNVILRGTVEIQGYKVIYQERRLARVWLAKKKAEPG